MIDTITKKRKRGAAPVDNYQEFELRLTAASESLVERRKALVVTHLTVKQLFTDNDQSLSNWDQNFADVEKLIDHYKGGDEGLSALNELLGIATHMQELFQQRVERLMDKLRSVKEDQAATSAAIAELERSSTKLRVSRLHHNDREKLRRNALELGGFDYSAAGSHSDHGLPVELKSAREAVAMAEALLELKGR